MHPVESPGRLKESYHKFDGVEEALVELGVLEIVLRVVCAVHHAARAACGRSKLLLACVLVGAEPVKLHTHRHNNNSCIKQGKLTDVKQQKLPVLLLPTYICRYSSLCGHLKT